MVTRVCVRLQQLLNKFKQSISLDKEKSPMTPTPQPSSSVPLEEMRAAFWTPATHRDPASTNTEVGKGIHLFETASMFLHAQILTKSR